MADFQRLNPLAFYETPKEVCPVQNVYVSLAVAVNQVVVPAVSGKRIRVMGMIAQTNNAAKGVLQFLDGAGGTILYSYYMPTFDQPLEKLPIVNSGYFETTTGNGLYATVLTNLMQANVFYITYTP